jgi:putative heme-binding domain-containing protein
MIFDLLQMKVSLARTLIVLALSAASLSLHAQGDQTEGSKIFGTNCAGCHGSDGRGGERAPNIATARNVASLTDQELMNFVHDGVTGAGMPSFAFLGDTGIGNVVTFLRALQGKTAETKVSGDDVAGRSLFFGPAACSKCHMMHGEGGFIASDLSDYGSGIAPERIRSAIVNPETLSPSNSEVIEVETSRGERIRGVLRSEDNFTAVLQLEDGRYRRFAKTDLKQLTHTGHSLMPADYKVRLSQKEVDDIVAYLVRSASPIDPALPHRKKAGQ